MMSTPSPWAVSSERERCQSRLFSKLSFLPPRGADNIFGRMNRVLLLLMVWLPVVCPAQLAGEFHLNFTNHPPLWDFTGSYALTNGAFRAGLNLTHAPSGTLTGTGTVHYNDGLTRLDANELGRGRITGSAASQITGKFTGAGQFSGIAFGIPVSGPFNGTIALTLDPTNHTLFGTETAMICIRGRGCRTLNTNVSFQLPAGLDGTWTLGLSVTTSNNIVRGTATAQLSNGGELPFNVRGAYSPATGSSRLKLMGTGNARGRRLSLRVDSSGQLQSLNGNLFGQRLVFP